MYGKVCLKYRYVENGKCIFVYPLLPFPSINPPPLSMQILISYSNLNLIKVQLWDWKSLGIFQLSSLKYIAVLLNSHGTSMF